VHSVEQKSIGLIFRTSRSGSDVRYSCHHNSSRFTFPIFAHSWCFTVRILPVCLCVCVCFGQEIIRISWNPKAQYYVQKGPRQFPVLNQYHPVHNLTVIVILTSHQRLGFPSDFFFQVFPTIHGMSPPHVCAARDWTV